jgi:hypothetical protein
MFLSVSIIHVHILLAPLEISPWGHLDCLHDLLRHFLDEVVHILTASFGEGDDALLGLAVRVVDRPLADVIFLSWE